MFSKNISKPQDAEQAGMGLGAWWLRVWKLQFGSGFNLPLQGEKYTFRSGARGVAPGLCYDALSGRKGVFQLGASDGRPRWGHVFQSSFVFYQHLTPPESVCRCNVLVIMILVLGCWPWAVGIGPRCSLTSYFLLPTSDFRLPTSDLRLPAIGNWKLEIGNWKLEIRN